jgi:hypothetical protein
MQTFIIRSLILFLLLLGGCEPLYPSVNVPSQGSLVAEETTPIELRETLLTATEIEEVPRGLTGDTSGISGDTSNIFGDASNISGDVSNISGVVTQISGNVSNMRGTVPQQPAEK